MYIEAKDSKIAIHNRTFSISFCTMGFLTFIVFLYLKVFHVWEIAWFWVWFPLWICPAAILALVILFAVIGILAALILAGQDENR